MFCRSVDSIALKFAVKISSG